MISIFRYISIKLSNFLGKEELLREKIKSNKGATIGE
jgi:hypothetical protein